MHPTGAERARPDGRARFDERGGGSVLGGLRGGLGSRLGLGGGLAALDLSFVHLGVLDHLGLRLGLGFGAGDRRQITLALLLRDVVAATAPTASAGA